MNGKKPTQKDYERFINYKMVCSFNLRNGFNRSDSVFINMVFIKNNSEEANADIRYRYPTLTVEVIELGKWQIAGVVTPGKTL